MHSGAEILTMCLLFFFNNPHNCIGDRHHNLTTARDEPETVQGGLKSVVSSHVITSIVNEGLM